MGIKLYIHKLIILSNSKIGSANGLINQKSICIKMLQVFQMYENKHNKSWDKSVQIQTKIYNKCVSNNPVG